MRRLRPRRSFRISCVTLSASGPMRRGPNCSLHCRDVSRLTTPSPRWSQNNNCPALPPVKVKTRRRCFRSGALSSRTNPVMRGSITIESPPSNCKTTRLPTRLTAAIVSPFMRRRKAGRRGLIKIDCSGEAGRFKSLMRQPTTRDPPAHGFNFGEFRHGANRAGGEKGKGRKRENILSVPTRSVGTRTNFLGRHHCWGGS